GEQDVTAHVNFGAIQNAGEGAGLRTDALLSQAQFLTPLIRDPSPLPTGEREFFAAEEVSDGLGGKGLMKSVGEWTPARIRQFQTLTHPEHLGRAFRVLIQSREA